jgi:hypothetical protein
VGTYRHPFWNVRGHHNKNFIQIHQSVQKVHPPQKFKHSSLWNSWSYDDNEYGVEVAFSSITSIQNFIQIHQSVQNLHQRRSLNPPFWSVWRHVQCHHLHTKFNPNPPISSDVIRGFLCTHIRSLNVRHVGMVEGTGLENMSSRWY